ncbi:histidine-phosphotransfer domain HPT domain-containing protein [Cubamyces sp. BRFM 1775]|nr:histidine-phosphotransfer domain HPT domain-containing protein [Cubamyces sp. BRFM 1775]
MSQTKTAVAEHVKSPERELSAKPRSPSPQPHDSRAPSQVPSSPKSSAARLTSPAPESASRATPAPERTPAPSTPAPSTPAPAAAPADPQPDALDEEISEEKVIDLDTFNQILDLDEDETHDFSLGMAEAYFTQASTTFVDMDQAFEKKDLAKLSSLGHFLKGSSAALGVSAVQATCEHIQHYGALRDEENGTDLTAEDALAKIGPLLKRVKREYEVAERWLKNWYKQNATPAEA